MVALKEIFNNFALEHRNLFVHRSVITVNLQPFVLLASMDIFYLILLNLQKHVFGVLGLILPILKKNISVALV